MFREPILHIDMDSFFVEVERLRDRRLVGIPVVVAGPGPRGVVASASYEARRHGVHSAMPAAHARRLCPHARFIPPDHHRYREMSVRVFSIIRQTVPRVEPVSVDEAYLDVSGLRLHYPDPVAVGAHLRSRLRDELGLPASVGVASCKLIAKLASEAAKPDGLMRVAAGEETAFLGPLPVRALPGVGESTHAVLEALGVASVADLAAVPTATLERRLGRAAGRHLAELARGHDPRPVETDGEAGSVSVEHTYDHDIRGTARLEAEVLRLSDLLVARLRRAGLAARTITLKVRFGDFTTITRSAGVATPVDVLVDVFAMAQGLLGRAGIDDRPVRLLGVGATGLVGADAPRQLQTDRRAGWSDVAGAVDRVRSKFGDASIGPARTLPGAAERPDDPG